MNPQETSIAELPREGSLPSPASPLEHARRLVDTGDLDDAEGICDALLSQPDADPAAGSDALNLLGVIRMKQAHPRDALALFESALRLDPRAVPVLNNAGEALMMLRRFGDALPFFQQAREVEPDYSRATRNIGAAQSELGRYDLALSSFADATRRQPGDHRNWNSLGQSLHRLGRLEEALRCFDKSVELAPGWGPGHHGRGLALAAAGRVDDAVDAFRRALRTEPPCLVAEPDLLLYTCKSDSVDIADIQRAHRLWGERHHRDGPAITSGADRNPHRRLRVGYLAPDFDDPAWAPLIKPVIAAHDRTEVEVFCYATGKPAAKPANGADAPNGSDSDIETARQAPARPPRGARRLTGLRDISDDAAAQQMAEDRIDVLIDLAGHLPGGRAAIFAWRPAPIQLGWARYPVPVGLAAISNRITDRVLDPEITANPAGDTSIRLPGGAFCWRHDPTGRKPDPSADEDTAPLPSAGNGYITFGCRAEIAHISVQTAANWAAILRRVSGSRLAIETEAAADPSARRQLADRFALHGIEPERLSIEPPTAAMDNADPPPNFWEGIDIGLDTQPWNGLEETCAALWHGVPVLTVRGETAAGRVGASLLVHAGFSDLVAETRGRMVEAAIALARDLPRLNALRKSLRTTLLASPLGNADRMARELEATYRRLWRHWCQADPGRAGAESAAPPEEDENPENAAEETAAPPPRVIVGGDSRVPGWRVVSARPGEGLIEAPRLASLTMFEDSVAGDVYLPNVLETLPGDQSLEDLLAEVDRILTPGGRLRISVPDRAAIDALLGAEAAETDDGDQSGDADKPDDQTDGHTEKIAGDRAAKCAPSGSAAEIVRSLLGEGEERSAAYAWDDLRQRLAEAGFRRIQQVSMFPDFPAESSRRVDGRPMILNVEAVKRASDPEA